MKLLVDMNLSPALCERLRAHGWEAVHWSSVGASDAADHELMRWARENAQVLVTHDLDFGALLATSGAGGPSVVQVRAQDVTPDVLEPTLVAVLRAHAEALEAGALVTADESSARVRVLRCSGDRIRRRLSGMTRALVLAVLGAGCTSAEGHDASTPHDAGTDAMGFGYDANYPNAALVHDCFEAFESVHGAPCAFEGACGAGDLCCRAHAYCSGGRLASVHLDRTCPTATPHPTACASAPVIARGATPLGPVVHEHGVASFAWGFTTDIVLSFTPAAGLVLCEGDRLGLWLASWNVRPEASTPEVTVHDAILQHAVAERVVRAPARVEITRYDYDDDGGRIAGRLRADAPGWDVELDFDLAACPALDRTGP